MIRALPLLACLFLAGCVTSAPVAAPSGNVDRLIAHPQFNAAAKAAPEFARDALKTVARLEHDLAIKP